jgi:hypothetical protein
MALAVAGEAQARSAALRGPSGRLVAACRASQEHASSFHLQQRIVALKAAHRAVDRSCRPAEEIPHRAASFLRGDDRRRYLLDVRRRGGLTRSLTDQ